MGSVPPPQALVPGQLLDRYELLCPVAQGGMSQVWVARLQGKLGFERLFAVKTFMPTGEDPHRGEHMFLDEARIISLIRHPNVAQVMDLGQYGTTLYLVLEWIEGDSVSALRRIVHGKREKIPLSIVLFVMAETCAGLHAAHELKNNVGEPLNVVHRDVSPSNVLVSTSGEVKVIDFGVAKSEQRLTAETAAGIIKGKVAYMSPEQALGKKVDRRCDIWACGVTLYHLLAGRTPYEADNQMATLHRIVQGLPPEPIRDVPAEVADIAYTALSYAAEGRFNSADEMQRALQSALMKHCGATTQADVAAYVNHQLSERISRRRRMIQRALEAAEQRRQFAAEIETAIEQTGSSSVVAPGELHTPKPMNRPALPTRASGDEIDALLGPAPYHRHDVTGREPNMLLAPPDVAPPPPTPRPPIATERLHPDVIPAPPPVPVVVEATQPLVVREAPSLSEARHFGTRRRWPLVIVGLVVLLGLVGYAAYLAWDRISSERGMRSKNGDGVSREPTPSISFRVSVTGGRPPA